MKKRQAAAVIAGTLLLGGGVFFATGQLAGSFLSSGMKTGKNPACREWGAEHPVVISGDTVRPVRITAEVCDTLTILNQDNKVREMAFGVHDKHITYDGVTVKMLAKDQSFTVALDQRGSYLFHDHRQEAVGGEFTVR